MGDREGRKIERNLGRRGKDKKENGEEKEVTMSEDR